VKGPSKKHSRPSRDRSKKKNRTVMISFMSKTGERTMSTMTPVPGGFTIAGAHRIVANLVLSPADGKATVKAKFKRAAATGGNSMSASLTRDLSDGSQQFTSLAVSAPTGGDFDIPLGVFPGRKVTWSVSDLGMWRTLTISVDSLDTLGTGEVWHLELCVCVPPDGVTDYDVRATTASATVTSVDVTP